MISVAEFRALCKSESADSIVDDILLTNEALHVRATDRAYIRSDLAGAFGIDTSEIELWIVGSAKLGFSLREKRQDGVTLPRYRPFGPLSDIDVAIVSPTMFRILWHELSAFAHGQPWMPWDSRYLGDYMVYGWLRPDHFPKHGVRYCAEWWNRFRRFSSSSRFERRRVRGGLFHSFEDLRRYQGRSAEECINVELGQV